MKYKVFVCDLDGSKCDPKAVSRQLCAAAVNAYCRMESIEIPLKKEVEGFVPEDFLEGEKGKPYLKGHPVHFNVSHSELLWLCMVGESPCGIDIQQEKDCGYERIAERHFNEAEQLYVKREGISGFFKLWTVKEAYGKYTGQGFYGEMPSFVTENGSIVTQAGDAFIREIEIGPGIYCACCTEGKDDEIQFIG